VAGEFDVHRLNALGLEKAGKVAGVFERALADLNAIFAPVLAPGEVPNTAFAAREKALIVTKMQEACFFAKRVVALNADNRILERCLHYDTTDPSLMCTPCWEQTQ
jgi:hypothetical protein